MVRRFTRDMDAMDNMLPDFMLQNIQNLFHMLTIMGLCVASTPYFAALVVPLGAAFFYIQHFFRKVSTEVKRLEGIARSPVISHFQEVLGGITTIRAYGKQEKCIEKQFELADKHGKAYFMHFMISRWLVCL